jgi:electron transfer flavoprotein beta subunit
MVPDVVEQLEVTDDGKALDTTRLRMIVNERDEQALEQALLVKERSGGSVTVAALEAPGVDDVLWTALACGADRAIRVTGADVCMTTRRAAAVLAHTLSTAPSLFPVDFVLAGCQAVDDLDGQLAPCFARHLEMPYLGLVTAVDVEPEALHATVVKEFARGRRGEYEVLLPAALGIQAAEKPPRHASVTEVQAARQSQRIEELAAVPGIEVPASEVVRLVKPEPARRAHMLEGTPEDVATAVHAILRARGLTPGGA